MYRATTKQAGCVRKKCSSCSSYYSIGLRLDPRDSFFLATSLFHSLSSFSVFRIWNSEEGRDWNNSTDVDFNQKNMSEKRKWWKETSSKFGVQQKNSFHFASLLWSITLIKDRMRQNCVHFLLKNEIYTILNEEWIKASVILNEKSRKERERIVVWCKDMTSKVNFHFDLVPSCFYFAPSWFVFQSSLSLLESTLPSSMSQLSCQCLDLMPWSDKTTVE